MGSSTSPSFKGPNKSSGSQKANSEANIAAIAASGMGSNPATEHVPPQRQPKWAPTTIQFSQQSMQSSPKRLFCSEEHLLDGCAQFDCLTLSERKDFIFRQRLCYRCLGHNHRSAHCRESVQCLRCKRHGHHTLLHSDSLPAMVAAQAKSVPNLRVPSVPEASVQNRLLQLSGTQALPSGSRDGS